MPSENFMTTYQLMFSDGMDITIKAAICQDS